MKPQLSAADAHKKAMLDMNAAARKSNKRKKKKRSPLEAFLVSAFGSLAMPPVQLLDPRAIQLVGALGLTQTHLKRLRQSFDEIDVDGTGTIDQAEFFEMLDEPQSPFTQRLFELIDTDSSGTIEFDEFVRVLGTYCMYTREEVLRFCFDMFDKDGSNAIDEKEFMELCKAVNNASPAFPPNFVKAMEEFQVNDDGLIEFDEFIELDRRYPLMLFPAFRLQDQMHKMTLGEQIWLGIIEDYSFYLKNEEYKATHNGKSLPAPLVKRLLRQFLPCWFKEPKFINIPTQTGLTNKKR